MHREYLKENNLMLYNDLILSCQLWTYLADRNEQAQCRLEVDCMEKIITNKIRCKKCGDIIESTHRHDFKFCKCGAVAVDGGKDYLRRCGNREEWEELSEYSD